MICPICSLTYDTAGGICPRCGRDSVFLTKTRQLSNFFYNKGLNQVNGGNMSDAIESLQKSVGYNKKNIDARNLLGLVYYQVGLIGDALKHWVISVAAKREDNVANDYLDVFQKNARQMERLSDSIKMYNKALEYVRQKSEDMAIIQLKKALEYNENFVDAMNLLCLCYFVSKQKNKIMPLLEKTLEIDKNNIIASCYYRELNRGKDKPLATDMKKSSPKKQHSAHIYMPGEFGGFSKRFPLAQLVSLVTGAAIVFAIMYFYVMPEQILSKDEELSTLQNSYDSIQKSKDEQIDKMNKEFNALDDDYASLRNDFDNLQKEYDIQAGKYAALNAGSLFSEGNYYEALAAVDNIKTEYLPTETKDLIQKIKTDSHKAIGDTAYAEGRLSFINNGDYETAKLRLETALQYALPDSAYTGDAYYFLGRIEEINGNKLKAYEYFKKVIDEYPNADNHDNAVNRAGALEP